MATTASNEASEIRRRGRRRLIGAIALVVLAVVFVPMILDSEPRPKRTEPSLEIPAKDNVPPLPAPAPKAVAPAPAAVTPAAPAAVTPAAPVAPAPAVEKTGPKLEGFAVQVGAFRDEDKLAQAREKLAFAGITHYVERRGDLNRLRAGPYSTREAAEKALGAVKAAALDGQVVPLP
ncbi:MAG TPA: SPOR domain-containing protein [Usitatibacter sp.]|nr:SPOR domain-containing protein [Usitatibacter sp.]